MTKLFISYRRDENTGYAGRIRERLVSLFGPGSVFMDLDDIGPGSDFVEVIDKTLASCDVLLVLVGSHWIGIKDSNGRRRLDDPKDFVRIEISKALGRNIRTIPILLNDAPMPAEKDLPQDLKPLCRHQAIEMSEERWDYDFGRLVEALSGRSPRQTGRRKILALVGAALPAVLAVLWWLRKPGVDLTGSWTADVQYDFGVRQREVFRFEPGGSDIRGTASFLGVDRAIVDGRIDGDRISFVTHTMETLGNDSRDTTHRYEGKVGGDEIRFVMQTIGASSDHQAISFAAFRKSGP
jgi:hypothetical protein